MTEKLSRGQRSEAGQGTGRRMAERRGRRGETLCVWLLRLRGWKILARRARTPKGEVDIIARRGRMVAFVEVKFRERAADLDLAMGEKQLQRVAAAVPLLARRYVRDGDSMRIDAMLVAPRRWPRHLVSLWMPMD